MAAFFLALVPAPEALTAVFFLDLVVPPDAGALAAGVGAAAAGVGAGAAVGAAAAAAAAEQGLGREFRHWKEEEGSWTYCQVGKRKRVARSGG